MADPLKIKSIIKTYPVLSDHVDMVEFVLDLRAAFKLEKVPFSLTVGTWSSGSLDDYYASVQRKRTEARLKAKGSRRQRPANQPYTSYRVD